MEGEAQPPVPVTTFGPLQLLALRVHRLANAGRGQEALAAADAYLALARLAGDRRTVLYLIQGKMYACLHTGRFREGAELARELLHLQRAAGSPLGEAKTLCDLAHFDVLHSQYVDGMRNLARAAVLLDQPHPGRDRRNSALCSFAEAATAAEMYETASATYDQLAVASSGFEMVHAMTLLYWGLRLGHVGRHDEGAARLRRSSAITRRHLDQRPDDFTAAAMLALALAKLGDVIPAEKMSREAIGPLRAAESYQAARMAHLALGISLRAQGALQEARTEFVAARELCVFGCRPDENPIIRFELALTALEIDSGQSCRDMFDAVDGQTRELWRVRLQRLAMLRQARQQEEAEAARARAEREVLRDPLTGLGNRRRHDLLLDRIDDGRLSAPLVLLVVDVDHFKAVNDAYSHSVGDRALREVARILKAHCRPGDVPVRYAGDEFTVFLRGDLATGREVAERIRAEVSRSDVIPGAHLTVSVGMAALTDGMTGETLFHHADERLYAAKWSGRNTIAS
jgi:diguanylate cyclase (GGDEF)-like protein